MTAPMSSTSTPTITIARLSHFPAYFGQIAEWFRAEWPAWYGPGGQGDADADVLAASRGEALPCGLVALLSGQPCGVAVLKSRSIPSHAHLAPWAAAGFVLPAWRGRGIGAALLDALEEEAAALGYPHIYCATATAVSLLDRSGWTCRDRVEREGKDVAVYQKPLVPVPVWLPVARSEVGVCAGPQGLSNPRVTAYHQGTNMEGRDDTVSWCSSFVHWALAQTGIAGTGSALARSWLDWGVALEKPIPGCITVLWRDGPDSWKGHVGFYLRQDEQSVWLLGGNQQASVCEHAYPLETVVGYRWPLPSSETPFPCA